MTAEFLLTTRSARSGLKEERPMHKRALATTSTPGEAIAPSQGHSAIGGRA